MVSLFYIGFFLVIVGEVWLIILALLNGTTIVEKILWAIVNLILQPLGGLVFFIVKRTGLVPLLMVITGTVLMFATYNSMMRGMIGNIPR